MKNVSINIGYYNYKGSNGLMIRSTCKAVKNIIYKSNCDTLEYDGQLYSIGQGNHVLEMDKTTTEETKVMILNMLCHYMDSSKETFNLLLSSPPIAYEQQKAILPMYMRGEYNIKWNGIAKKILINKVAVLPETFLCYFSNNVDSNLSKSHLLIWDIGGCTTNIVRIVKGNIDVDEYISKGNHGCYNLDFAISQYLNTQYISINTHPEDIEYYREYGLHIRGSKEDYMEVEKEAIIDIYCNFINKIITWCKDKGWDYNTHDILVTGGGGKLLFPTIKESFCQNAVLSKNPIFDNLYGLEFLQEEVLSSESW